MEIMVDDVKDTVILKCEVQKTYSEIKKRSNVWELLLSVATTYSYKEDKYRFWTYQTKDQLIKYLNEKHIVCFNGVKFDIPLLLGEYCCDPTFIIKSDRNKFFSVATDLFMKTMMLIYRENIYSDKLFEKMSKHPLTNFGSYSLNSFIQCTLGVKDTTSNSICVELFKKSKTLDLIQQNLCKLRYIKNLYEFLVRFKYLINGDYDVIKYNDVISPKNVTIDSFLPF